LFPLTLTDIARCQFEKNLVFETELFWEGREELKTRNNDGLGTLEISCHRNWLRDGHERWLRRERGFDVILQRISHCK
jgi:hypothetical protein